MAVDQFGGGGFQGGGRDDGRKQNQGETAPAEFGFGRKVALAPPVNEESGCQIHTSDQQNPDGDGSGNAEENPGQPADGQEHGQRQEIFEGVHPGAGLGEEGEGRREKGKKKDGGGEAEGQGGEDGEGADCRQGEGGGEGDAHEGCSAGGGDSHGEEAGGKRAAPTLAWAFAGKVAEQDIEFKEAQKIQGKGKEEGQQKPDHRWGLELKSPAEGLARGAQDK